jgi:hypothetical protein
MNSWFVWLAFALITIVLGLISYFFSLRALRVAAAIVALAAVAYLTWYGLAHPAKASGSLSDAFTRGVDVLIRALFHLPPVPPGHYVPGPGQIGWLIIAVLLVIGYRLLEALSQHCHARCLDTSELTRAQQTDPSGDGKGALTDVQRHDRLAAKFKFWLPAVEVRAPAILPGGSRSTALASIAEASGVNGSGLAGAIIRFFGMLWPSPRKVRVRVWVDCADGPVKIDAPARVAVSLDDPGTGVSIGTKTLAAGSLDDAACVAAGYVARRIFAGDPTAPPWSIGAADGGDLAAMLLARQVRVYPESEEEVKRARCTKIELLEEVANGSQCAGVVRYELAHLHDLAGHHVKALALHATNQEQYPRFYRGRYRLAMSLEMIASSDPCTRISVEERATFEAVLRTLHRWDGTQDDEGADYDVRNCELVLSPELRSYLLTAAGKELQKIRKYLTLRDVIWQSFWHRNERGVLKPYWQLRHRQSFHDGVFLAQLLVAVRQTLNDGGKKEKEKEKEKNASSIRALQLPHRQKVLRIATAIAGDSSYIAGLLGIPYKPGKRSGQKDPPPTVKPPGQKDPPPTVKPPGQKDPPPTVKPPGQKDPPPTVKPPGQKDPLPMVKRLRTRRWPWQYSTPSWPAAYNLACVYAAIYAHRKHQLEACMRKPGDNQEQPDAGQIEDELLQYLAKKVVTSLEFAINNPESEMDRPSEWIDSDPDFGCLHPLDDQCSRYFMNFLDDQKQRDYPPHIHDSAQSSGLPNLATEQPSWAHKNPLGAQTAGTGPAGDVRRIWL